MTEKREQSRLIRSIPLIGDWLGDRIEGSPRVSVLYLAGAIGSFGVGRKPGLTLIDLESAIERAFRLPRLRGVAIIVNSPGGVPAQAALISGRIQALSQEKGVPVYAFCEDVAASGGYWLACGADEIYAVPSSIVGSIGVISAGFGLQNLIERWGIERRIHTAGVRKSMLDPFESEKDEDVERLRTLHKDMHEEFMEYVRERRGARLNAKDDVLFSGEFWSGQRAADLGLIDGLGDMRQIMREKFGDDIKLHSINRPRRAGLRRFMGGQQASLPADMLAAIEDRLLWSRYGL